MSKLPLGWTSAGIYQVLDGLSDRKLVHQGWSPRCDGEPSLLDSDWAVLKTTAIQDGRFLQVHNKKLPVNLEPKVRLEVSAGDLLLTCAGPRIRCGVACLVRVTRPRLMISGKMYRFRPRQEIVDGRILEAFLRAPETREKIDAMKTGISESGMNITHDKFSELVVPLPPLTEQKRIADKLDAVLARVDACRDRLDRIPGILKRFRQSVLAAATSGQLTADWRTESAVGSMQWQNFRIGDLLREKPRNGYSPKSVEFETTVKSLTLSATTSGKFKGEYSKFIDENISENSYLWLSKGDILIQRANSLEHVGVSAIFDGPERHFIFPDLMMKCRANALVETGYLHLLLSSYSVRKYFRENATGTAGNMPKINQQTVISAPAKLPPMLEQGEIVRRVETLFAFADRLEIRITAARESTDRLTPALLAKAFRGELVPQDPNDEPAAELLKRLAADNTTTTAKAKRGKKAQSVGA